MESSRKFCCVRTDQDSSSLMPEALKIYEIMRMVYKSFNAVVRMPDSSGNFTVLDLYSGFLYQKEIAKNKRNEYGRSKCP
jgi:hypothetical protein